MQVARAMSAPIVLTPTPTLPTTWQLGDVLSARVIGRNSQNSIRLEIEHRTLVARSNLPARPGQKLALQVAALGDTVVLKLRPDISAARSSPLHQALARDLPRHASQIETLQVLRQLTQLTAPTAKSPEQRLDIQNSGPSAPSPPLNTPAAASLRLLMHAFVNAIPSSAVAENPPVLRELIRQSMRPLEQKLLHLGRNDSRAAERALGTDLRVLFGRAMRSMDLSAPSRAYISTPRTNTPPSKPAQARQTESRTNDLWRSRQPQVSGDQLDGALARSRAQQLIALQSTNNTATPLVADVAVRHDNMIDLWHFEVAPDNGRGKVGAKASRGCIKLRLQLSDTIAFDAEISGNDQALSVRVGAHDQAFATIIRNNLGALRQRLEQQGMVQPAVNYGAQAPLDLSRHRQPLINDTI